MTYYDIPDHCNTLIGSVMVDVQELLDIIDELLDKDTLTAIQEGRTAIKSGAKGVLVSNLFNKVRENRK